MNDNMRPQITEELVRRQQMAQQQQQRPPVGPLGSPFAPPPVPQRPVFAGTPNLPIAAPTPQYGFQTGFDAAYGPKTAADSNALTGKDYKTIYAKLFGSGEGVP
jgi:hypothetical protein